MCGIQGSIKRNPISVHGSQGDRQGRPYKNTVPNPLRVLVRATLAVALQAALSPVFVTFK